MKRVYNILLVLVLVLGLVVSNFVPPVEKVSAAGAWESPTGGDGFTWSNVENAYDGDDSSAATHYIGSNRWSTYDLELTHATIDCTKVQFKVNSILGRISQINLDVYYEDNWHDVYEGGFGNNVFVEKELGDTYSVTKVRMYFYNSCGNTQLVSVKEFYFWGVPVIPTATTQAVSSIEGDTATGNGTITDDGYDTPSAWGVCVDEAENPDTGDDVFAGSGAGEEAAFTASITGLTPGTLYHVRAYVTNTAGTGYGSDVTFTTDIAPTVTTIAATYVEATTARLNSYLDNDGRGLCGVRFGYGTTTQVTINAYDEQTAWTDYIYNSGAEPPEDIDTLLAGTEYFFRVEMRNDAGTTLGDELSFTTKSGVSEPSNFVAYPSSRSMTLSWIKGEGATQTLIRVKLGEFPEDIEDGDFVYLGTASTFEHTDLEPGTNYYYSAWGISGDLDSEPAYATVLRTTSAGGEASDIPDTPSAPAAWWATTDYTVLENVVGYNLFNIFADSYGISRRMAWGSLISLLILLAGIITFRASSKWELALIVAGALFVSASLASLIPMWLAIIIVLPAGAILFLRGGYAR